MFSFSTLSFTPVAFWVERRQSTHHFLVFFFLFRETIILESEGSSSGTETTTTVTFRLGGTSVGTTSVKQSQTKIKSHKIALMEELAESSVASR